LPLQDRRDLYYASLLKDAGCSSGAARLHQLLGGGDDRAAKQGLRRVDWANYLTAARYAIAHTVPGGSWFARALQVVAAANLGVTAARELAETRCTRGAAIATQLGFGPGVATAVASIDEHWDGHGQPRGLAGREIPMLSRIMGLAQTLETFAALEGATLAVAEAKRRRGTWFDPALVVAIEHLEAEIDQLCQFDEQDLHVAVLAAEPGDATLLAGPATLDRIARAFAAVIDGKSPYTAKHSVRVARISDLIATELSYSAHDLADLRRAALLHDLGKLSVSNTILDKPGLLSSQEWDAVRLHPYYTQRILSRIPGLGSLAFVASSHHERLDGRGYFRGLRAGQLPLSARILAVADSEETALRIMERDRNIGLDADCLEALVRVIEAGRDTEADQDAA
jgi:HD-GYP domain-containing protein (c-di-GMP phosphodiesterase class II)